MPDKHTQQVCSVLILKMNLQQTIKVERTFLNTMYICNFSVLCK